MYRTVPSLFRAGSGMCGHFVAKPPKPRSIRERNVRKKKTDRKSAGSTAGRCMRQALLLDHQF